MPNNEDNTKLAKSRRQLLKASVAGTGALVAGKSLPEQWSRPLVESVVLPAHAQTSLAGVGGGLMLSLENGVSADEYIFDSLIPSANAGALPSDSMATAECCCSGGDDTPVDVKALVEFVWDIPEDEDLDEGLEETPCRIRDVGYFTGRVNPGVPTFLSLQNGPCFIPEGQSGGVQCRITATMNGGTCSGNLEFSWAGATFSSPFVFEDPNCPISTIPGCNQGDCVIENPPV